MFSHFLELKIGASAATFTSDVEEEVEEAEELSEEESTLSSTGNEFLDSGKEIGNIQKALLD